MAHYDRRLLVPYLQDVCSVELLCAYLQRKINECNNSIMWFENAIAQAEAVTDPEPPIAPKTGGYMLPALLFLFVFFFGALLSFFNAIWIAAAVLGAIGAAAVIIYGKNQDKRKTAIFEEAFGYYNRILEEKRAVRNNIPQYQATIRCIDANQTAFAAQFRGSKKLRNALYSINIIPAQYQNIHAAYYLYDYFQACQEADFDQVIQALPIDEIRQTLDKKITQNKETLLKQRRQIAMQEHQNPAQAKQQQAELQQIAMLEQNQDLQLIYQNMLAIHQKVSSFFLTVPPAPTTGK